jgi:hypothetical protein
MRFNPTRFALRFGIAVVIGFALEWINGALTFMLPPTLVILPVCIAFGIVLGLRAPAQDRSRKA